MQHLVVYVTAGSPEEAQKITQTLIQEKLAACVNRVGPVLSTYEWKGKLCEEEEYLLIIKTRQAKLEQLTQRVRELHSYEVSEIIALPVQGGSHDYLNWVTVQTREED